MDRLRRLPAYPVSLDILSDIPLLTKFANIRELTNKSLVSVLSAGNKDMESKCGRVCDKSKKMTLNKV